MQVVALAQGFLNLFQAGYVSGNSHDVGALVGKRNPLLAFQQPADAAVGTLFVRFSRDQGTASRQYLIVLRPYAFHPFLRKDIRVAAPQQRGAIVSEQLTERVVEKHPAMLRILDENRLRNGFDHRLEELLAAFDLEFHLLSLRNVQQDTDHPTFAVGRYDSSLVLQHPPRFARYRGKGLLGDQRIPGCEDGIVFGQHDLDALRRKEIHVEFSLQIRSRAAEKAPHCRVHNQETVRSILHGNRDWNRIDEIGQKSAALGEIKFRLFALRDIAQGAGEPDGFAVLIPGGLPASLEPAVFAGPVAQPVFHFIRFVLLKVGLERCDGRNPVLRMQAGFERVAHIRKFAVFETKHRL